jgi:carboxyl-terminal processing protease
MLNLVGWVGAAALAAGLLRVLAGGAWPGGGREETAWRALESLPLAALALAVCHGWLALQTSPFVVLFAMPAYLAAALLIVLSRRQRRDPADAARAPSKDRAAPGARLLAAAGVALLAFSVVRLVELHALRAAATSPPELRREERELDLRAKPWPDAFGALCADLEARYPFTAWKGIDWRQRCAAVAPCIAAAAARHDAKAYYRALRELAWGVPDGHVGLEGDDHGLAEEETGGDFGLRVAQLADGRVVVRRVLAEGAAERAGLRYGAEILSWNGLAVNHALARVPVLWADWPPATAEARRVDQLRFLARAPVGARAAVTFRNRGASQVAVAVLIAAGGRQSLKAGRATPEERRRAAAAGTGQSGAAGDDRWEGQPVQFGAAEAVRGGAIEWRRLPGGAGYIRVKYELPTLLQVDPARQVRRAVAGFLARRAAGIVLDVRGNGGGLDVMVPRAVGCFFTAPRVYEIPAVYGPAAGDFVPLPAATVRVLPLAPHFAGRIAVLIDGSTLSSGEGFPLALRGVPNTAVFGFSGTGGFFAIAQRAIRLPAGVTFIVPVGRSLGADGRIQVDSDASGRGGVAPDHRLAWTETTLDAVCLQHRDLVLEAAVRWLAGGG